VLSWLTLGFAVCWVFATLFGLSFVSPLEVALLQNEFTAYVDTTTTYGPGVHSIGIAHSFIRFPSNQQSVVFGDSSAKGFRPTAGPISTRTGEDKNEPDSAGQPIDLCLSFQYQLPVTNGGGSGLSPLGKIYAAFGNAYEDRFVLIARNTISDVAQHYSPVEFWTRRTEVAEAMLAAVQTALKAQGHVDVTQLQLLRIDFPVQYEDMITKIQLQVQSKATKEYEQKVIGVLNDLYILTAKNDARIGIVQANAQRRAATNINSARQRGVVMLQAAKANATRLVADSLALDAEETVQFLKIQALKAHPSARTVVGVDGPFSPSATPTAAGDDY
jgi:hypothetical protein